MARKPLSPSRKAGSAAGAAGYSGRSLVEKLGVKPDQRLALLSAPPGYERLLGPLPDGVVVQRALRGRFDFIQQFLARRADLDERLPRLAESLEVDGALWISWPKRSSGVACDFAEDDVRGAALPLGLVDVKVCAIDATWSGLKLVHRLRDRPALREARR
jgi:hypothetical protein